MKNDKKLENFENSTKVDSETPKFVVNDRRFWNLDEQELENERKERSQMPTYIERLEKQLEEKDKLLKEYIAAYKEEVNKGLVETKNRLERDAAAQRKQLLGDLAAPMLDVLGTLELSIQTAETSNDVFSMLQGLKNIRLLMVQKLKEMGLERIETIGLPFDPNRHQAVSVVPVVDVTADKIIIGEISPGFILEGRVIRAAQVMVGKLQQ